MRRRILSGALVITGMLMLGTLDAARSAAVPATDITASAGNDVYLHSCITCHGDHGQGVPEKTEPLEGPVFQARDPSALIIFDTVRSGREPSLVALTDDQVWAAIEAELRHNGVDLGATRLDAANAAAVLTGPAAYVDPRRFFPPGH